jgi:hypothetical protein
MYDRLCGLVVRVPGYRSRDPWFDSRRYQIFWEIVGLERGPLSLVRIIEKLLECKSSDSGHENRINGRGDPFRWPRDTLYPQKLALTSPTGGGHSVGIVRLRTKGHGVFSFSFSSSVFWSLHFEMNGRHSAWRSSVTECRGRDYVVGTMLRTDVSRVDTSWFATRPKFESTSGECITNVE